MYYQEVIGFFLDPLNLYGYEMLAKVLSLALEKGILTRDDLFTDDETVLMRLRESGDGEILRLLERIHPRVRVTEAKSGYDFHRVNKLRIIDPEVWTGEGELVRASSRSIHVKSQTERAKERALAGTYVKILHW
jgi:HD superfamily phosphohydrolase